MKKFMLMAMIATASMFTACSNDDDGGSDNGVDQSADLTGTWEPTNIYYEGESTSQAGNQSFTTAYTGQSVSFEDFVVLINDDQTYESSGSYTLELTVESMDQEITQEITMSNFLGTGTWERNGNEFTTTDDEGNTGVATIETLNDTTLKLTMDNYTMPVSGVPGSNTALDLEMTLERQ
jgi:hypothetical protein